MKKLCIALLLCALLLPHAALAAAKEAETSSISKSPIIKSDEIAMQLLDEAVSIEDFERQAQLIQRAAETAPGNPSVLHSCARLLFYLDAQDEYGDLCIQYLKDALALTKGEEHTAILQTLTEQLVYAGHGDEAFALIDEALEETPEDQNIQIVHATTRYYMGENAEAVDILENLLEDAPDNINAQRFRAAILLDSYRYDEALEAYRQIDNNWPEYLDGLYGQYKAYMAAGEFERSGRVIDQLLRSGGEYNLWMERAQMRIWKQYDAARALDESLALIKADPNWVDAYVIKLSAYIQMKEFDEAKLVCEEIAAFDAGYADLLEGIICMNERKWEEADALFDSALEKSPGLYTVWQNKAVVQLEAYDDVNGALRMLKRGFAATDRQGTLALYTELGHAYSRQSNLLEAARAYAAGDDMTRDDPTGLYYLTMTCMDAGRRQDMIDMLTIMETRYPGWYETMLARALVENALNNNEAALSAFQAFAEKFPDVADDICQLEGLLLAAAGQPGGVERVREWMEREDTLPADGMATYANALLLTGDLDGAAEALDKAESLLEGSDPAMANAMRISRIDILTIRADLKMLEGDLEGAVEALREAAKLGWQPASLAVFPRYAEIYQSEAFQKLLSQYPSFDAVWDLMPMPTLPK